MLLKPERQTPLFSEEWGFETLKAYRQKLYQQIKLVLDKNAKRTSDADPPYIQVTNSSGDV